MGEESGIKPDGNYWRIKKWFPKLDPKVVQKLDVFHNELLFFNSKINLISPKTARTADLVHIADGLLGGLTAIERFRGKPIYDIGSGNGIPGIVMGIMDETQSITMIDADARKIEFLRHCIHKLQLTNCKVLNVRVEELPEGMIRCGVTRGFAAIGKTLLLCRKAVAPDCELLHFKGPNWSSEVASIPAQVLSFWEPVHTRDYKLPETETVMSLVLTRRISV